MLGMLIPAALSLGSALIGSKSAKKASNAQVESTKLGIGELARQYDTTRADFAPWREAGGRAIGQLSDMLQPGYDHTTSPGYQFRFNEGQRAVESGGAARGSLFSGGTLKDLVRFGQGVAADDFNQQFGRVATVANGGQQANTAVGSFGQNTANGIADLYTQQGNARASGYAGQAAAWGGLANNLGSMFMNGGMKF